MTYFKIDRNRLLTPQLPQDGSINVRDYALCKIADALTGIEAQLEDIDSTLSVREELEELQETLKIQN